MYHPRHDLLKVQSLRVFSISPHYSRLSSTFLLLSAFRSALAFSVQFQSFGLSGLPEVITTFRLQFVGLAYPGKDVVFRFIIEYNSLREFGP